MKRELRALAKDAVAFAHRNALRAGLVVLPNHYYTPVADQHALRRSQDVWARRSSMIGVEVDVPRQAAALRELVKPFEPEYRGNTVYLEGYTKGFGPGFGYIEAQCFHGVLRALKPRRIVEVGSGVSTYCAMQAGARNAQDGKPLAITCIEPNPSAFLRRSQGQGLALIASQVQAVDPGYFCGLEAGDMLFIDSTHAVKPGGDVLYLYLEVIPRLKPGVIVQIHDIYLPYIYQRDVLTAMFQWSETALLQALMTFNPHLTTLFCLSQLHYDDPDVLSEVFPDYRGQPAENGLCDPRTDGHFPASIYLQTR